MHHGLSVSLLWHWKSVPMHNTSIQTNMHYTITLTISVVPDHNALPSLPEYSHLLSQASSTPTIATIPLQLLHKIADSLCQLLLSHLHHLLLALHHQRHDHLVVSNHVRHLPYTINPHSLRRNLISIITISIATRTLDSFVSSSRYAIRSIT